MEDVQPSAPGHARQSLRDPLALLGRVEPWGRAGALTLLAAMLAAWCLRLWNLAAEGFGDDEVHKWLAAGRYLHGDFSGDDVEHPMLMKVLITLVRAVAEPRGVAPETIVRLPNALASGLAVWVVALLGRRLFGRTAGLLAALLAAVSTTYVGYQRVAKEDTLLGLFLMLLLLCAAEAKAACDDGREQEQRRFEVLGALSLAGLLASKYFPWLALAAPIFVYSLRAQSNWTPSLKRWLKLAGLAFVVWLLLDWSPFLPSTWEYAKSYTAGKQTVHGSLYFMGRIYHNLVEWGWNGTPPWFYLVFTAVKFAPLTVLFAALGLGLAFAQRRPAHKLLFAWMGIWFAVHSLSGSKWGRFYLSVLPAFLLLAGWAMTFCWERAAAWLQQRPGMAPEKALRLASLGLGALVFASVGDEARISLQHAPHHRLYISPFGGGDANVDFFFPHCDDFDAGFREAVRAVAERAERGAELSTEIDWPATLYAERFGRADLVQTLARRGRACRQGRVCYVITQRGRRYFLNEDALANLAKKEPWHVEKLLGQEAVKVYRLPPGESPFADENESAQRR